MRNFTPDSWEGIRQMILDVPLSHPFWRVDKDLGRKPWVGPWDSEMETTPQTPPFSIPLVYFLFPFPFLIFLIFYVFYVFFLHISFFLFFFLVSFFFFLIL
jgi:hypothetical protein